MDRLKLAERLGLIFQVLLGLRDTVHFSLAIEIIWLTGCAHLSSLFLPSLAFFDSIGMEMDSQTYSIGN